MKKESNGFLLNVQVSKRKFAKGNVVFCHGMASDMHGKENILDELADEVNKEYNVYRFDFRGHGKSSGQDIDFNLKSGMQDLDSVINIIEDKTLPLILFGFSIGGGVAIKYFEENRNVISKVILWSPALAILLKGKYSACAYAKAMSAGIKNGELKKNGYITVPHNGFRISKEMIVEASKIKLKIKNQDNVYVILGSKDISLNYNLLKKKADKLSKNVMTLCATHSLIEEKEKAIMNTIKILN